MFLILVQCRNHSWVSFQGFCESYNDAFNLPRDYTIYNEKYFQKVSFCVITHPIGQNGRAVCKKHGNHGDTRARRKAPPRAPRGRPAINREFEYSSTALGPAGPRPRLQYS